MIILLICFIYYFTIQCPLPNIECPVKKIWFVKRTSSYFKFIKQLLTCKTPEGVVYELFIGVVLGLLFHSSTAQGSSDGIPDIARPLVLLYFVPTLLLSMHFRSFLLVLFLCFFVFFNSCSSHVQVFGNTFVHELHIFVFLRMVLAFFAFLGSALFWLWSAIILNTIIIIILLTSNTICVLLPFTPIWSK